MSSTTATPIPTSWGSLSAPPGPHHYVDTPTVWIQSHVTLSLGAGQRTSHCGSKLSPTPFRYHRELIPKFLRGLASLPWLLPVFPWNLSGRVVRRMHQI